MKPKKGDDSFEMEEPAQDPLELVKQLVLLIVEARTPDASAKGRVEGPHCPVVRGGPPHHCARDKHECVRARDFCRSAEQLWTNGIPICMDILLFPDCRHGWEEVMVTEGTVSSSANENALLVERWMVMSGKRRHDSGLGSNLLLQAVRSYLHFSQISSWLYSQKGHLPDLLAYRIYAPGEETSLDFTSLPDTHVFPLCVSRCDSIKVSVSALQRLSQVPVLLCASDLHRPAGFAKGQSVPEVALATGKFSVSRHRNKPAENTLPMNSLKFAYPNDIQQDCLQEADRTAKGSFWKQKPKQRKNLKQDACNEMDSCSRWSENGSSAISKSRQTDLHRQNLQARKDGTWSERGHHKEVLKEYKNGTEERRMWQPQESDGCDGMVDGMRRNPKVRYKKKDGEKDQRIEQMKSESVVYKEVEMSGMGDFTAKKKPCEAESKKPSQKHDGNFPFLLMDNPASQKQKFWTEFSQGCGYDMEKKAQRLSSPIFASEKPKEKPSLRKVPSPDKWFGLKPSELDVQSFWCKASEMGSGDVADRKSNLAASEAYEEEFIRRLSDRMSLATTKPLKQSYPTEINPSHQNFDHRKQCGKTKTKTGYESDILFIPPTMRKEGQQDSKMSSNQAGPLSPHITDATDKTIPGQTFEEPTVEINPNLKDKDVVEAQKLNQALSQLTVDISFSELDWDSDDTPTASPNHLNSSRSSGDSLFKAVTARQMRALNSVGNNVDKDYITSFGSGHDSSLKDDVEHEPVPSKNGSTFILSEYEIHNNDSSALSSSDISMKQIVEGNAYCHPLCEISQVKDESLSCNKTDSERSLSGHDIVTTDNLFRPQGTSRKIFQENLLPLASYDAQTDSFKMVDPKSQAQVLHSPKVLLSCDVPADEALTLGSGRCINFEEEAESEVFMSRLQHIDPSHGLPGSIGSYMSCLADMSVKNGNVWESKEKHKSKVRNENELPSGKYGNAVNENKIETQDKSVILKTKADKGDGGKRETKEKRTEVSGESGLPHNFMYDWGKVGLIEVEKETFTSSSSLNNQFTASSTEHDYIENKVKKQQSKESSTYRHSKEGSLRSEIKTPDVTQSSTKIQNGKERCLEFVSESLSGCVSKEQKPCGDSTISISTEPKNLASMLVAKDLSSSGSTTLSASLSSSFSSSSSSSLTNCSSVSSPHLLLSSSPNSSNHSSSSSAPSPLISPSISKCQDSPQELEKAEGTQESSVADFVQTKFSETFRYSCQPEEARFYADSFIPSNGYGPQGSVNDLTDEADDSHIAEVQHSSNISSSNRESYLSIAQQFHNHSNNAFADNTTLSSLSTVDAKYQRPSQGVPSSRPQPHHAETKSTSGPIKESPACSHYDTGKKKDLQNGTPLRLGSTINPDSSLADASPQEIDNHLTFDGSSPRLSYLETKSALKDNLVYSALDDLQCGSTDKTATISNGLSPSANIVLKHPRISSLVTKASSASPVQVSVNQKVSDEGNTLKGSSFSNFNAINTSLRASQSLSIQTNCDKEGKSLNIHASPCINNDIGIQFSSSIAPSGCSASEASLPNNSDVHFSNSNSGLGAKEIKDINEIFYPEVNDGDIYPITPHISETILNSSAENHVPCNITLISEEILQTQQESESGNLSKLSDTVPPVENISTQGNLLDDPENCTSSPKDTPVTKMLSLSNNNFIKGGHIITESIGNESSRNDERHTLSLSTNWNETDNGLDDNDDSEVFFYLDENSALGLPKTIPVTHHSSLTSSLMLSSSSSSLLADRPFSSYTTANAGKSTSLSTEAGLDLECCADPDLDTAPFGRSRMPSYGDNVTGWMPTPPHRSVSTPDCAERDIRGRGYQRSTCCRSTSSVLPQNDKDGINARSAALKSCSMIFNSRTSLPTQSSPAPLKRKPGGRFDYDASLLNVRAIKNAFSCSKLALGNNKDDDDNEDNTRTLSMSAPASTNCLLGNFEESILNGRIDPVGTVAGFSAEIGASGTFCPKHLHLPVSAFFFALSDDNAPSPYLGHINLTAVSKKGYHIPKKGTVQVTLFNPNKTVVKMFVVMYDLTDMPPSSQTFIRQRTMYIPSDRNSTAPSYLRYLIHLRCSSSRSGKIYLHTDIRLIFARHKLDIDAKTVPYEMKSYTDVPRNPKYSPKK